MATFWTGSGSNVSKCQVHILCSGLRMETSPLSVPVPEALGRRACNKERRVIANQQLTKCFNATVNLVCVPYSKASQNQIVD